MSSSFSRTQRARIFGALKAPWVALLLGAMIVMALPGAARADGVPAVTTDKPDYAPEETVTITGSGLAPGEYAVPVTRPDGSVVTGDGTFTAGTDTVTVDASGTFTYSYILDGILGIYTVRVFAAPWDPGSAAAPVASTTFTDGLAKLDQCANGGIGDPAATCAASGDWVNGDLNASKAHYFEGHSVPYRLDMTKLLDKGHSTSHTVSIEWDTTEGGRHALDYLTSYNRTQGAADPCAGIATCAPGTFTTFPIPLDPNVSGAGVTQIGGQVFTLFGGTITGVSTYTISGTYAGKSQTSITISFTAPGPEAVLAWGGHLATRANWGAGKSVIDIPGSNYHMRLLDLDGKGGNQDRSLKVIQADSGPPVCKLTSQTATSLGITVKDTGSGIAGIVVTKSSNFNTFIPGFFVGTQTPLVITATKINNNLSAQLTIKVFDVAGNVTVCDPVITIAIRENGKPVTESFTDLPQAERYVTVTNGSPGIASLEVTVNRTKFKMALLRPAEVRTIDVGSAMKPGDVNAVSLTASGKPGGTADIMIAD